MDPLSERLHDKFDIEEFVSKYRYTLTLILLGTLLIGIGILFVKGIFNQKNNIEILENSSQLSTEIQEVVVEIVGAVEKPGVYKLSAGSRVEDLLIAGGGISADADRGWMEKMVNRAAKLSDGQKIYIQSINEQTLGAGASNLDGAKVDQGVIVVGAGSLTNVNSANQSELEDLTGIGPVYAQSIIEHRPYSNVEELASKGALKQGVYEKIKDSVTAY